MRELPNPAPLRLAIIGGGFTGAVLAIHAIRVSAGALDIVVLEPRAELGRGVAYGTADRSHRLNVPSDRMDIAKAESGSATAWFRARGVLPDPESEDGSGRAYVPRGDYGTYIADRLATALAEAGNRVRLRHLRSEAEAVRSRDGGWTVVAGTGEAIAADRVALCFGHAVPALPGPLGPGVPECPRFVPDPWAPAAFAAISPGTRSSSSAPD